MEFPVRIGIHTSTAKSLAESARLAHSYGGNTWQIFSASPRMWRCSAPKQDCVAELHETRAKLKIGPLVVHASYLINLASADEIIRPKSIAAFRSELERCLCIKADYLVIHPGNYKGQSIDEGVLQVVRGIIEATKDLDTTGLTLLLENTAGSGAALGSRFEELAAMRELSQGHTALKTGVCLDTCHLLASGYDVATPAGLAATVAEAQRTIGLENVPVIHANDSKTPLGSHVDRHEHIGDGHIGKAGFRGILQHPALADKAFILETPQVDDGDEIRNIKALKRLWKKSSTTTA